MKLSIKNNIVSSFVIISLGQNLRFGLLGLLQNFRKSFFRVLKEPPRLSSSFLTKIILCWASSLVKFNGLEVHISLQIRLRVSKQQIKKVSMKSEVKSSPDFSKLLLWNFVWFNVHFPWAKYLSKIFLFDCEALCKVFFHLRVQSSGIFIEGRLI